MDIMGISSEMVNKGPAESKSKELNEILERKFYKEIDKIIDLVERTGCSIAEAMDTLKIFNNRELYIEILKNKKRKKDLEQY